MVIYKLLADLVVVLHATYVTFVVIGFLLILLGAALRWRWVRGFWFRVVHLVAITIVCVEAISGLVCPLTTLENQLREKSGQTNYTGEFIGHWVHQLIFFDAPPWVFTFIYVAFGLLVLSTFLLAPPQLPWRTRTD